MNASTYVQVDGMMWFPLPLSSLPFPAPCSTLPPSTVPSASLTLAGQYIVDDTDFVEVDLDDDEIIQSPHSFLKSMLSRVASFFRRIKSVFKRKDA
ncbi:uncharacterized protein [Haliotis asinina]|uniref:uncharacterized protein n=1 Tax=Haliotis asinina TaxID=109174 RepID=UPI003531FE89